MSTHRLDNPKAYLRDHLLPNCLHRMSACCQPDRRTRAFAIARTKLSHETNAFDFIRQKRYVNAALNILLSKKERKRLREDSRYEVISKEIMRDSAKNSRDFEKSSEGSGEGIDVKKPATNAPDLSNGAAINTPDHSNGAKNTSGMPSYYDNHSSTFDYM